MENKLLNKLINELTDSSESFNQFSKFVRDYEILFKEYDLEDIWFELEIINALALYDWEQSDKYTFWSALWEEKYKSDIEELILKYKESILNKINKFSLDN